MTDTPSHPSITASDTLQAPSLAIQNPRAEGARILQILCDEPLDGETLATRIGKKSWHEIQPDVAYLEGQGYVVPNPRNISGRIIYIPSITKKGRAFVENGMQPSPPKGQFLRKIDIFISSPSDVYEERQRVKRVIERCSRSPFIAPHFALRPFAYEDSVPAEVGNGPVQDVIDRHMKAGSSDLFICILWHRMGTPVTIDGERFQSGTEYEFVDAYRNKQRHGKPYMLLYRGMKPLSPEVDLQQLKAVEAFFERFTGEHAELEGNVRSYRSTDEFDDLLRQDIEHALNRL